MTNIKIDGTINKYYMLCTHCKALSFCPKIKPLYDKIQKKVDIEHKKHFKIFNDNTSGYDRLRRIETFNEESKELKKEIIIKKIKNHLENAECIYEKEIAKETLNSINIKYDFETNPQIYNIAEQIVKLRLQDFRLAMAHKNYGIMREDNKHNLKLTPGLHYTVEISRQVGDLLEKAEKIVNGNKLNINIKQKWEDKLIEFKKLIIESDNNELK